MPNVITRTEYLSFAAEGGASAVPLNTPAWECVDYSEMYDSPPVLGGNRHIPGAAGRYAIPLEEDEREIHLPMKFFGGYDHTNSAHTDPRVGLRTNLRYFRTNLMRAASGTTRTATFHRLDGGTESAEVQIIPPLQVQFHGPALAYAVLTIIVPAGVFT